MSSSQPGLWSHIRYDIQRCARNLKYGYEWSCESPEILLLGLPLEQIQENTVNVDMNVSVAAVQVPQPSWKIYQPSIKNYQGAPTVGCATMEGELGAPRDRNWGKMHSKNEGTQIAWKHWWG